MHYVPGWDCHGMPIEIKAVAHTRAKGQSTDFTPIEIREKGQSSTSSSSAGTSFSSFLFVCFCFVNFYFILGRSVETKQASS